LGDWSASDDVYSSTDSGDVTPQYNSTWIDDLQKQSLRENLNQSIASSVTAHRDNTATIDDINFHFGHELASQLEERFRRGHETIVNPHQSTASSVTARGEQSPTSDDFNFQFGQTFASQVKDRLGGSQ
jgi:hypothetical protein